MGIGKKALCWFNGPSARQFWDIDPFPIEIGCNFIEQHRAVHHVCAYDQDVIQRTVPRDQVRYWTRKNMATDLYHVVPSEVSYSCSGTMAVRLAVHLGAQHVYVIGCDWEHTDSSVFDGQYTWRSHAPKKFTNARRKTLESTCQEVSLTVVGDRRVPYAGVDTIKPGDFLRLINC